MKTCVICGVRVANESASTCDKICTEAKKNGVTRERQIEMEETKPYPTDQVYNSCSICGCVWCICMER